MTFLQIQTRFLVLIDESTITTNHKSHINASVQDVVDAYPFSWNVKSGTVTLASNVGNLPTDFNPKWGLLDARIENTGKVTDVIFTPKSLTDRDSFGSTDAKYWITYSTSTSRYIFNSTYDNSTITIYYYFFPTDMSSDSDVCVVPNMELVALLAASKHFLGEDQDDNLVKLYETRADDKIKRLYAQGLNFSEVDVEYSPVSDQTDITVRGG
jgi:hypothetical protein